jgi:protein-tyrosine phosphatase/membrane-associated phospholipid phosphatase
MKFFRAALVSLLLSVLFLVVYSTTNWISSRRADVGMIYFEWEMLIPFVPLMIIPYMSIDLFFVAAPFLCRSDAELRTLAKRISLAIMVAGVCFLLFPLKIAFKQPAVAGWLGQIFNSFHNFDRPYNLLPSLHITFRTILASFYAHHTRGVWRIASAVWFSLIGFSTVLTYQHQVVDVAGGFVLAGYCFYLIREDPARLPVILNRRVGAYYLSGALLLSIPICFLGLWGVLLLWPVVAVCIVAVAYFGLGPGIYRKEGGRLPRSTLFVLGPCLLGQQLSLAWYQRQCRPWDEVLPRVWIGRKLNDHEASQAAREGVTAVLDLTAEFNEARPFLNLNYLNVPLLDLTAPSQDQLSQMARFISDQSATGTVYVHCKIGYSRSAAAVGAWLLSTRKAANVRQAVEIMRRARPSLIVRPEIIAALETFNRHAAN